MSEHLDNLEQVSNSYDLVQEEQDTILEATTIETPFSEINALNIIQTPTQQDWIKSRKSGGTNLSYVSGDTVIRMLNKAFRYRWSFVIKETRIIQAQDKTDRSGKTYPQGRVAYVLGQLTVPGWGIREQWGSQVLTGGADVQEHALKSAATDSMKKCASMFGVALDLYGMAGAERLMTTPTDYVMDDSSSFNELRERILAAKQQQNPPAEPDLEADNEEHSGVETEDETGKELHNQEENTQAVQAPVAHVAPPEKNVETPVQPPAAENPVEVPWQKEDILAIKEIMQTLNMTANVQLNPFVQEFMRSEEATIQAHIRPSNVKDFIVFMQNRIRALQNESAE